MIYLFVDENNIKLLYLKKTLLGQFETVFFEKKHETKLLENGKPTSTDLLASAIKEALSLSSSKQISDKDVFLVLPQESFYFVRSEIPQDIAESAVQSFILDKARSTLSIDLDNCISDYFVLDTNVQKVITFYAMDQNIVESYRQALTLIDLKITSILPDTLAYFKLFEKTLRKDKRENILYAFYEKDSCFGYVFDSYGLIEPKKWSQSFEESKKIEDVLKKKAVDCEEKKLKLNRIVLSGALSDTIRQDTFTKAVSVWTNPLKRIIPTFYNEYLKMLLMNQNKQFPILNYDVCFGAFIFHQENKQFSLLKKGFSFKKSTNSFSLPKFALPIKEIVLFGGSFGLSFLFFILISNMKFQLPSFNKPKTIVSTPTLTPSIATPTPTPSFKKESLKIKILNGSGTKGKATEVKDIFINKGYKEILTGNADNFDYEKTELQIKKSKTDIENGVKNDLKDYVSSFKVTVLPENEAADLVVIIGKDFK